jgi:hypothetical protein
LSTTKIQLYLLQQETKNKTRTYGSQLSNLAWNLSRQAIVKELQMSCKRKMMSIRVECKKNIATISMKINSLKAVIAPTSLGILPVKLFVEKPNSTVK